MCLLVSEVNLFYLNAYAEDTVSVIACSDFQHPQGNVAGKMLVQGILNKMADSGAGLADGFLCCGDYDYEYNETAAGVSALKEVVSGSMSNAADMVLVQGNHDQVPIGTAGMSKSGNNDPASGKYGVFVINEDDYMWYNNDESTVKRTAQNLIEYMNGKLAARYDKPIFIISHLPLHYSMRTKNDGDGQYANYIFDVLNKAGEKGLNIFFLFGHDHSNGWDDYLGGARVYLKKGDTIQIAQSSKDNFKREKLQFTYMNAGYIGYYTRINTNADDTLTMTSFDITANDVKVNRYSQNGICGLKTVGVTNTYQGETGYDPYTNVYTSLQTVALTSVTNVVPIKDLITQVESDGDYYETIKSTDELLDGEKYLVVYNNAENSGIMLPEVTGTDRIGFKVEHNTGFGADKVTGSYREKEWMFTKSGDGWKIGNGTQFAKLTNTSDKKITATLENEGDTFTISGASGSYAFNNGTYVLNYNSRGLINGYPNDPATFLIYRFIAAQPCRIVSCEMSGEKIKVSVRMDKTAYVLFAGYDAGGRLLNCNITTVSQDGVLDFPQYSGAAFYKAFMWDADYRPLCESKSQSAE